jgi:hypothetical protein
VVVDKEDRSTRPSSFVPSSKRPTPSSLLASQIDIFRLTCSTFGTSLHCSGYDIGHEGLSRLVDIPARVTKQGLYSPTFSHPAPPIPCHTFSSTDAKVSSQSHMKPQISRFSATHAVKPKPACAPFTALSSGRVVTRKALDKLGENSAPSPQLTYYSPFPRSTHDCFFPFGFRLHPSLRYSSPFLPSSQALPRPLPPRSKDINKPLLWKT